MAGAVGRQPRFYLLGRAAYVSAFCGIKDLRPSIENKFSFPSLGYCCKFRIQSKTDRISNKRISPDFYEFRV